MSSNSTNTDRVKEIQQYIPEVKIKKKASNTSISARDLWPYITKTAKPKIEEAEQRFTLYDLQGFSKLCPLTAPENRYVRIGGYVNVDSENIYLVSSRDSTNEIKVKIDCSGEEEYPKLGIFIEVFGRMQFLLEDQQYLPFVQMYFCRKLKGSYPEYVQLIDVLKNS